MLIAETAQGCSDTVLGQVIINELFTFYAPNAFTPNEDGLDESFVPKGEGWNNSTFNMWVFDRWGNMIFKTTDPHKGWDGRIKSKGDVVQEDVYVWKVQLYDIFGKHHQYQGTVSLIK